jgi:hypothetical protein
MLMNEFTITNIITKKEFNIMIERVEIGYFLEGMKYKSEELPKIEKMLFITNIIENSVAEKVGIIANETIIIGNEGMFFESLLDLEKEIVAKKAEFVFYNFVHEKVEKINFEAYRNENGELRLGFECEVIKLEDLVKKLNIRNNVVVKSQNLGLFEFTKKEEEVLTNGIHKTEILDLESTVHPDKDSPIHLEADLKIKTEINPFENNQAVEKENITINPFVNDKIEDLENPESTNTQESEALEAKEMENKFEDILINEQIITGYYLTESEIYITGPSILKITDLDKNTINVN